MIKLPELIKKTVIYFCRSCPSGGKYYWSIIGKKNSLTEAQATEIIRRCEAYNPWIPVSERLPKNMKRALVFYHNELGKARVTVAEYIKPKTILAEDYLSEDCPDEFYSSEYDKDKDCYWTPAGWYESTYHGEINWYISDKIISWKPITLPEQALKEADNE